MKNLDFGGPISRVIKVFLGSVPSKSLNGISILSETQRNSTPSTLYEKRRSCGLPGLARTCPVVPGCATQAERDPSLVLTRRSTGRHSLAKHNPLKLILAINFDLEIENLEIRFGKF